MLLTGTEARDIAAHLLDGDTLTTSLKVVATGRRPEVRALLSATGTPDVMISVLQAIEGARSAQTSVDPLWTMPGHLAQHGRLTSSVTYLVENARYSVVCSTFNFQRSSGLWEALQQAARRPEITMKVYMDTKAADGERRRGSSPTTAEVATHLRPAVVMRTKQLEGRLPRNHSKLVSIDHRFLLVTSANMSWSAENSNVELGVLIDNQNLAQSVERELRDAEDLVFERVQISNEPDLG